MDFLSIQSVSGKVGNKVYKKYNYGTVVTKYPDMSKAGCSPSQKIRRTTFQQAVTLAKQAISDPEQKQRFKKMKGKGNAFSKAVSFYMREVASESTSIR